MHEGFFRGEARVIAGGQRHLGPTELPTRVMTSPLGSYHNHPNYINQVANMRFPHGCLQFGHLVREIGAALARHPTNRPDHAAQLRDLCGGRVIVWPSALKVDRLNLPHSVATSDKSRLVPGLLDLSTTDSEGTLLDLLYLALFQKTIDHMHAAGLAGPHDVVHMGDQAGLDIAAGMLEVQPLRPAATLSLRGFFQKPRPASFVP